MNDVHQKAAAKKFSEYWKGKGYEKGESQKFWIDLLEHVYGVEDIVEFIAFEDQVHLDHTSFIDGYIPSTHVLIEQKGLGKDLRKGIKQSDGSILSPFQQAKRYAAELPYSQRPRWIITCNFSEFLVYDMEKPNGEPEQIFLKDLSKEYYRLQFLVNNDDEHIKKEMEVSLQAGELVGKLYNAIQKQYKNPNSSESLKSLNMLCVRLVFCLYAEDAGIFGKHAMFHDYLKQFDVKSARRALIELFKILDTTEDKRDPYDETMLSEFPYVNGGLFRDEDIEIPNFNEEILDLLLNKASEDFDWSEISPTIFGAVFESTLNPNTRRSGGMHYTSIENIHKVIDPLFLDDLYAEFENIKESKQPNVRKTKLLEFQKKISSLKFLDPASGSGNFLTETYLSLRRLENKILKEIYQDQIQLGFDGEENPIKVSISQFYGIEINDFAVTVAKTALWIAESQMLNETEEIIHTKIDFLPLKSYANIVEGNALRMDWESIVPKNDLNYIMGNPPFVGFKFADKSQKADMQEVFANSIKPALLDYVCCWYKKAAEFIQGTNCEVAFVSTNSISQGQMAGDLWSLLLNKYNLTINFAWRTFVWESESSNVANVHVVIVGIACFARTNKVIYSNGMAKTISNISPYLIEGDNTLVTSRKKPLCNVPEISMGNQAMDGGNLIIEESDYDEFIANEPNAIPFIKRYMMGYEFINNKKRWCLWLVNCSPVMLRKMPYVLKRVKAVQEMRASSSDPGARRKADTPTLFREQKNPKEYIAIPITSSQQRKYIPMGYLDDTTIAGNTLFIIENATLYHFGVLTSNVHMAWMRTVGARMKSDYRYSKDIVYNNFPWCNPTPEQKAKIEETAQAILDARALYPECSLADLYDELAMPVELRKAHQANDFAVMSVYGFDKKITESECVAELMKMYKKLAYN